MTWSTKTFLGYNETAANSINIKKNTTLIDCGKSAGMLKLTDLSGVSVQWWETVLEQFFDAGTTDCKDAVEFCTSTNGILFWALSNNIFVIEWRTIFDTLFSQISIRTVLRGVYRLETMYHSQGARKQTLRLAKLVHRIRTYLCFKGFLWGLEQHSMNLQRWRPSKTLLRVVLASEIILFKSMHTEDLMGSVPFDHSHS